MSFIIDNANKNRIKKNSKKQTNLLFRGLKMVPEEADGYQVGNLVSLTGYTSTSKSFATAFEFATDRCNDF